MHRARHLQLQGQPRHWQAQARRTAFPWALAGASACQAAGKPVTCKAHLAQPRNPRKAQTFRARHSGHGIQDMANRLALPPAAVVFVVMTTSSTSKCRGQGAVWTGTTAPGSAAIARCAAISAPPSASTNAAA